MMEGPNSAPDSLTPSHSRAPELDALEELCTTDAGEVATAEAVDAVLDAAEVTDVASEVVRVVETVKLVETDNTLELVTATSLTGVTELKEDEDEATDI